MSTLTRKFERYTHPETGLDGWIPSCAKGDELFRPGDGILVAHDTLEHFRMDMTMEDEMMALGSIWYIRAETGRIRNYVAMYRSPESIMASDIADVFRQNMYADLKPRVCGFSENTGFLRGAKDAIRGYFVEDVQGEDPEVYDSIEDFDKYMAAWFETAFAWVHHGYCMARKRWEGRGPLATGHGANEACDLFFQLADDVKDNYGEKCDWAEGETMTIHVNVKRRSYNIVTSRGAIR